MAKRTNILAFVLVLSLALVSGISVVGLLQSSERIGTSGIIVRPDPPPAPPPPAPPPEPEIEIDVYADESCSQSISSIEWGSLEPGNSVNRIVYVKNSGSTDVVLGLLTENWNPAAANEYLNLSWDYDGNALDIDAVLSVTLTLSVDSSVSGVTDFNFDIVIIGSAS